MRVRMWPMPGPRWLAAIGLAVCGVVGSAEAHELSMAVVSVSESEPVEDGPSRTYQIDIRETLSASLPESVAVELEAPTFCVSVVPRARVRVGGVVETAMLFSCATSAEAGQERPAFRVERHGRAVEVLASIGRPGVADLGLFSVEGALVIADAKTSAHQQAPHHDRQPSLLWIGVVHVLTGWDHLLFLFALFVVVRSRRALVTTITAFTLGHSAALAIAVLVPPRLPPMWIEFMIAASIAALVAEGLGGRAGIAARMPWWIALGFGCLHGLGFASVWADLRPLAESIGWEIFKFNLGVEGAQLAVAAVLALIRPLGRFRPLLVCVGSVAVFVACNRLALMFLP